MKNKKILLADDHKIVLDGLKILLNSEFDLVGQAPDGRSLIKLTRKFLPDVVVADITMPLLNGIEAARQIKAEFPKTKIIFLTMHQDPHYAVRALEAGASGFVLKHSAAEELVEAIRTALSGGTYITASIADKLSLASSKTFQMEDKLQRLTPRQKEVLQLLAEGKSAREVALHLNISQRTVEFHKYRTMDELGIKSAAELIQFAVKCGLVSA